MASDTESRNTQLMLTLDDAFNSRDWDTFEQRHKPDTVVHWPGMVDTVGSPDHRVECVELCKTFPDARVENRPYRVFFASGDWTCLVGRFSGTMRGPMRSPDGQMVEPNGRSFEVDFCTVARWEDGQIAEENLFYDVALMLRQLGLSQ